MDKENLSIFFALTHTIFLFSLHSLHHTLGCTIYFALPCLSPLLFSFYAAQPSLILLMRHKPIRQNHLKLSFLIEQRFSQALAIKKNSYLNSSGMAWLPPLLIIAIITCWLDHGAHMHPTKEKKRREGEERTRKGQLRT